MNIYGQIHFYLSEREPKEFVIINKHGEKREMKISGFHYEFMYWKRIVQLFHPRKFPVDSFYRVKAGDLCKFAIECAMAKNSDPEEAHELRKAHKNVTDACSK